MNNIPAIRAIEKEIDKTKDEFKNKTNALGMEYSQRLKDLNVALEVNLQINDACLTCDGKGTIEVPLDTTPDSAWETKNCPDCNGTGIKQEKKNEKV